MARENELEELRQTLAERLGEQDLMQRALSTEKDLDIRADIAVYLETLAKEIPELRAVIDQPKNGSTDARDRQSPRMSQRTPRH